VYTVNIIELKRTSRVIPESNNDPPDCADAKDNRVSLSGLLVGRLDLIEGSDTGLEI